MNKPVIQFRIGAIGSLLVTAITVLSQLLNVQSLDSYLNLTVTLFALSVPLLGLDVYLLISELLSERAVKSLTRGVLRFVAIILFFIAMSSMFMHFSQLAGILFVATLLLSVLIYIFQYVRAIGRFNG